MGTGEPSLHGIPAVETAGADLCRCRETAPRKRGRLPGDVGGTSSSSACDRGFPSHSVLGGLQAVVVCCFEEGGVYFQGMLLQSLFLRCNGGILSPI